tara:strand:+ start:1535 stop:2137 length:603 start_codon:yes stop_codon:yes gene_type:complete
MVSLPSFASVSANISFASDYIWRGMTQSDGPAVSGGFDYASDEGFYAGIWGSNVNFNNGAGSELDYYFGYSTEMGNVSADVGYIKFDYPDSNPDISFEEIYVGLSIGDLGLFYAAGQDGASDYMEASYEIGSIGFSYGVYDDVGDNFSVSYGFTCGSYDCAFTYTDFTNDGAYGESIISDVGQDDGPDEDALVFSVSASF